VRWQKLKNIAPNLLTYSPFKKKLMTLQKEIEKNNVKKKMNIKKTKVSKNKKALYPT
jgi:hypothetical protein